MTRSDVMGTAVWGNLDIDNYNAVRVNCRRYDLYYAKLEGCIE